MTMLSNARRWLRSRGDQPAGYQSWRRLFFAHWSIASDSVRALVPRSLDIDEFAGKAYLSLVPFVVVSARPSGAFRALSLRFLETNIRTYVRDKRGEPGVYFFSLDAASLLAVAGARIGFGLPYFWATGREHAARDEIDYSVRRHASGARCHVRYRVGEPLGQAQAATLDHFLIERYVLYVQRFSRLWSTRVSHRPYPLHAAHLLQLDDTLLAAAGLSAAGKPALVHFSPGVDVEVFAPRVG